MCKKLYGLDLPSSLEKVSAHMKMKDATIRSTQVQINMLIMEQWVTFHLDQSDNKDFVNQTAGMRQFRSYSARGLAHATSIFATSPQLLMQNFEQKSQHCARRN